MHKNQTIEEIQNFEGKYPKQLWYLFMSEMWERFCFYGMRGMLAVFLVKELLMKEDVANLQYGATQAFVYAFTFIGGLFADKILGLRKSLFWGGLLMITGSVILSIDPKEFFFLGISFSIIGTGFFKPNISSMVGSLYKDGDHRRDAGFYIFYSGINIGALLGGYICIWLGKNYSWNLAFGMAAIVMTISLLTFVFTQRTLGPIGLRPLHRFKNLKRSQLYEYLVYAGSLITIPLIMIMVSKTEFTDWFMYIIGPCSLVYIYIESKKYNSSERKKILAGMIFIFISIFFWAFYEQSGGSLSIFAANNLNDHVLGIKLDPNGVNNASNALFVIIFAPLTGLVWLWMAKRKMEPNTVTKFGLGFLILGLAFFIFYATRFFANAEGITSLDVFTLAYFVITFGELCLSPISLSIITKLSPAPMQGVMMGMLFLASAYGQYAAGILGAGMTSPKENASLMDKLFSYTDGYLHLGIYALVFVVLLIVLSPLIRRLMQDVK